MLRFASQVLSFLAICVPIEAAETIFYPAAATSSLSSPPTVLPRLQSPSTPPGEASSLGLPLFSNHCIITPRGSGQDDSSQILDAVSRCGRDGLITLPAPYIYTISKRLHFHLSNSRLEILGSLSFLPDIEYWSTSSFRIEYLELATAFIVSGENIEITGGGWMKGGIDGHGQAWMTRAQGISNQPGRPIPLTIFNATNVVVKDFSIRQPQFWALYLQDVKNVTISGLYVNGTNADPAGKGKNFESNIDGVDTLRVDGLVIEDMVFRGGDDCLSFKGNTTNVEVRNVTCLGGGVSFGSMGQYKDAADFVENVNIANVTVGTDIREETGGSGVSGGIWFKSWPGIELEKGGGGHGKVRNVSVHGLRVEGAKSAVGVKKCYHKGRLPKGVGACDSSTLSFEELKFKDIKGTVSGKHGIRMGCSAAAPCRDVAFEDVELTGQGGEQVNGFCKNVMEVTGNACNRILPGKRVRYR